MDLSRILLGENDDFLHESGMVNRDEPIIETQEKPCAPSSSKFDEDVKALRKYIGESDFQTGLTIEITLAELLDIVPRQRRRTDAYTTLIKHLKNEYNIELKIIKANEKENFYNREGQGI